MIILFVQLYVSSLILICNDLTLYTTYSVTATFKTDFFHSELKTILIVLIKSFKQTFQVSLHIELTNRT